MIARKSQESDRDWGRTREGRLAEGVGSEWVWEWEWEEASGRPQRDPALASGRLFHWAINTVL